MRYADAMASAGRLRAIGLTVTSFAVAAALAVACSSEEDATEALARGREPLDRGVNSRACLSGPSPSMMASWAVPDNMLPLGLAEPAAEPTGTLLRRFGRTHSLDDRDELFDFAIVQHDLNPRRHHHEVVREKELLILHAPAAKEERDTCDVREIQVRP